MKILRKVTIKTIYGDVSKIREAASDKGTPIMRVWGIGTGVKTGKMMTPDGEVREYNGLTGDFRAQALPDGEVQSSGVCYLPDFIVTPMVSHIRNTESAVKFALDVVVKKDSKSATGYQYEVVPILEEKTDDPLAELTQKVQKALPSK